MYGRVYKHLGATHGMFGNFGVMLKGIEHVSLVKKKMVLDRIESTTIKTAITIDNLTNWPVSYATDYCMLQWCHGAPGIIQSLLEYKGKFSSEVDDLILQAGELIWESGPVLKGPSLCHGTIGNGQALFSIYQYNKNEKWLERAQRLGMHTITQIDTNKYSLWTGKMGVIECLKNYFQIIDGINFCYTKKWVCKTCRAKI